MRSLASGRRWIAAALIAFVAVAALVSGAPAQVPATPGSPPAKEQPKAAVDPLGRSTPQGMVDGFLDALAAGDYRRAARFLDLRQDPEAQRGSTAAASLARDLERLLSDAGSLTPSRQLSRDPAGQLDDGLPPDRERIGTIRTWRGSVDLVAHRIDDPEAGQIWLVSAETVARIPLLLSQVQSGPVDRILPRTLSETRLLGAPIGHWLALLALAALAYLVAWAVTAAVALAITRTWRGHRGEQLRQLLIASAVPIRLFLAVRLFDGTAWALGVSIVARQAFSVVGDIVTWIALAWFLWRAIDVLADIGIRQLANRGFRGVRALGDLVRRSAKLVITALAAMAMLDALGVNVTTGLAALGIGGIALALGAQKTLENFVGSLSIVADQPMQVGDFCRFGDTVGTIEDIGIRSTRVRTLDRTIITVPNGQLATLSIENFGPRNKFWFHPTLVLSFETTPDQIRYLLVEIRSMFYAHPKVDPRPARLRLTGIARDGLQLEVFAYIDTRDGDEFLEVQEDLLLRILDILRQSGAALAVPSQINYPAGTDSAAQANSERRQQAEDKVATWRQNGEMPIPRFTPERIAGLRGSITYPEPASGPASRRAAE